MKTSFGRSKGAEYWCQIFQEWKSSGLSVKSFCGQKQIVLSSFYNWKQRLSEQPAIVELPTAEILNRIKGSERIILSYNDFQIELSNDFSEDNIFKLLNILKRV